MFVEYVRADNGLCAACETSDTLAAVRAEVVRLQADLAVANLMFADADAEVERLKGENELLLDKIERLRARIERARALLVQAFPERKQYVSLATIIAALDGE